MPILAKEDPRLRGDDTKNKSIDNVILAFWFIIPVFLILSFLRRQESCFFKLKNNLF